MYDILHDTKCVTFYMMQNAGCATWHKMYDMLHGENMLHDAQCVTCYMTENVWHVTWHKKCHMLHVTKNVMSYMPQKQ